MDIVGNSQQLLLNHKSLSTPNYVSEDRYKLGVGNYVANKELYALVFSLGHLFKCL